MTIEWINPTALFALAATVGPILIHLLRRERATRVPFPSIRFLTPSRGSAVRVRMPSDLWLLALRLSIVAGAGAAWAQPVIMTNARRASSDRSIARAVVVDTSRSMASRAALAHESASAERAGAATTLDITAEDLGQGLGSAVAWLERAPVVRCEIVVVSDFQVGSLTAADVAGVPAYIGLRFVPIATSSAEAPAGQRADSSASGVPPVVLRDARIAIGAPAAPDTAQTIELRGAHTRVVVGSLTRVSSRPRVVAPDNQRAAVDLMLRSVASSGAPALPDDRAVAIAFPGAAALQGVAPPREAWMIRAILSMRLDRELRNATGAAAAIGGMAEADWLTVVSDAQERPLVAAASIGPELVVRIAARPDDYVAAAAVRAALFGVTPQPSWIEHEVEQIPAATLESWSRAAGPTPEGRRVQTPPGDARRVWLVVLALLCLETVVRRRSLTSSAEDVSSRAA